MHGVEHDAVFILNIDSVVEDDSAFVFGGFGEGDANQPNAMCSRKIQVGELNTFVVRHVHVVVQMKVEPGHSPQAIAAAQRSDP